MCAGRSAAGRRARPRPGSGPPRAHALRAWAVQSRGPHASLAHAAARRFWFAGDTGYAPVFTEIGDRLGPFDLAAIPTGAYEPRCGPPGLNACQRAGQGPRPALPAGPLTVWQLISSRNTGHSGSAGSSQGPASHVPFLASTVSCLRSPSPPPPPTHTHQPHPRHPPCRRRWFMKPQHINPAEAVQIHQDVKAQRSVACHLATFWCGQGGAGPAAAPLRAPSSLRTALHCTAPRQLLVRGGTAACGPHKLARLLRACHGPCCA